MIDLVANDFAGKVKTGNNYCCNRLTTREVSKRDIDLRGYLGGPIRNCTDAEANNWRSQMIKWCEDVYWINPMARDYRKLEYQMHPDTICEPDLIEIRSCDFLIANMWKFTAGTMSELIYAATHYSKPTFVVTPDIDNVSVWIKKHATLLFEKKIDLAHLINHNLALTTHGQCVII